MLSKLFVSAMLSLAMFAAQAAVPQDEFCASLAGSALMGAQVRQQGMDNETFQQTRDKSVAEWKNDPNSDYKDHSPEQVAALIGAINKGFATGDFGVAERLYNACMKQKTT